ncbi:MAG TPA: IS5 family transposase [Anaeromyxobacteraceae bacterium]|nr:IS5 family transposase [Anaeromyxobacteraceae bacterium]
MRGRNESQVTMLSLVTPDQRVPKGHPLRRVKALADAALEVLSPTFDAMYSKVGRPSIPPERLLKATLLMAFYSVRSERLFCEQLDYNLLFRWFLDMDGVEESFDHSTFSRNRQRLLEHEVAAKFLAEVVRTARDANLMSDEHFTVDGTLIEAWASLKSFRPKGEDPKDRPPPDDPGNPTVNFHGEKRSNETHASTTDPEARLARKGNNQPAKLSYLANALMENRNGLLVDLRVEPATGYGERVAALAMLAEHVPDADGITLGADAGYDTADFVAACRERGITPHVAQTRDKRRRSAVDGRTVRHAGYEVSQRIRKRVEEIFGWTKTVASFRKTRFKGQERTQLAAHLVAAAYNLLRIARLMPA